MKSIDLKGRKPLRTFTDSNGNILFAMFRWRPVCYVIENTKTDPLFVRTRSEAGKIWDDIVYSEARNLWPGPKELKELGK